MNTLRTEIVIESNDRKEVAQLLMQMAGDLLDEDNENEAAGYYIGDSYGRMQIAHVIDSPSAGEGT